MLSLLITIGAFVLAIVILVSLHEFGHYMVARWCGIKVLRFSVGFGKPFYTKKRGDTEWCLAPIPLGGYVKMVDTREGNVAPKDLPYAFDKQHPAKRIAVVAAGVPRHAAAKPARNLRHPSSGWGCSKGHGPAGAASALAGCRSHA